MSICKKIKPIQGFKTPKNWARGNRKTLQRKTQNDVNN